MDESIKILFDSFNYPIIKLLMDNNVITVDTISDHFINNYTKNVIDINTFTPDGVKTKAIFIYEMIKLLLDNNSTKVDEYLRLIILIKKKANYKSDYESMINRLIDLGADIKKLKGLICMLSDNLFFSIIDEIGLTSEIKINCIHPNVSKKIIEYIHAENENEDIDKMYEYVIIALHKKVNYVFDLYLPKLFEHPNIIDKLILLDTYQNCNIKFPEDHIMTPIMSVAYLLILMEYDDGDKFNANHIHESYSKYVNDNHLYTLSMKLSADIPYDSSTRYFTGQVDIVIEYATNNFNRIISVLNEIDLNIINETN